MRLRETPRPIHAESLVTYSSQLTFGPNTLKRIFVLLAVLSSFLGPHSFILGQIAQRPTNDTSIEQCDENQVKTSSIIHSNHYGANTSAATPNAKVSRSDESKAAIKDRLRLPGVSSDTRPGETQQTQCTTDEEQGATITPSVSKVPASESGRTSPIASVAPAPLVNYSNGILTINAH